MLLVLCTATLSSCVLSTEYALEVPEGTANLDVVIEADEEVMSCFVTDSVRVCYDGGHFCNFYGEPFDVPAGRLLDLNVCIFLSADWQRPGFVMYSACRDVVMWCDAGESCPVRVPFSPRQISFEPEIEDYGR